MNGKCGTILGIVVLFEQGTDEQTGTVLNAKQALFQESIKTNLRVKNLDSIYSVVLNVEKQGAILEPKIADYF